VVHYGKVAVLGPDDTILSYTHPAKARKLVRRGKAWAIQDNPPVIKLVRNPKEATMPNTAVITNFTDYFREERDVYVQNRSNTQVSLAFELFPGRSESVLIPRTRNPLNLTQSVPFEAIKNSIDFRKMINRRPAVLALLTEEEYLKYYQKRAEEHGTSTESEIEEAHQHQAALQNHQAYTDRDKGPRRTIEERTDEAKTAIQSPEEKITARVVGLCANVGDDVEEKDRMGAREMLDELKQIDLTPADLEYLLGRGYHPTIKKYAQRQLDKLID